MPKVFISYRREDSQDATGRIYDHLAQAIPRADIFRDVDNIPIGTDFRKVLDEAVSRCDVVLVVIGPRWAAAADGQGRRRLQSPDDFVRIEVESALKRGIPVVPVLVSNASIPAESELPDILRELRFRNGVKVRPDPDFRGDMGRLIRDLEAMKPAAAPESPPAAAAPSVSRPAERHAGDRTALHDPDAWLAGGSVACPEHHKPMGNSGSEPQRRQSLVAHLRGSPPDGHGLAAADAASLAERVLARAPKPASPRAWWPWLAAAGALAGVVYAWQLEKRTAVRTALVPAVESVRAPVSPLPVSQAPPPSRGPDSAPPTATFVGAFGKAGIEWIHIPGGTFMMGSNSGNPNEKPVHRVTVKAFQMSKTEVTNKQYRACVEAGPCTAPDSYRGGNEHPVVNVNWGQARMFAQWVGGRLPTEAEWEYAARSAGKDWDYPWGNQEATCKRAVIKDCGSGSAPVCSKTSGKTAQGLCDMAGNVWEWVQDGDHGSYVGAPTDGSAWKTPEGSGRVNRGGSWHYNAAYARAVYRSYASMNIRYDSLGFRLAR